MARNKSLSGVCVAALLLSAGVAVADVTADDVWAAMGGAAGKNVSAGSVTRTAAGIEITDLTVTGDAQQAIGFTTATLAELRLRNMGDGRVEVLPGGAGLFKATAKGNAGETLETEGKVTAPNARIVVSGTPGKMLVDVSLPEIQADFATTAPGQKVPVVTVAVTAKGATLVQVPADSKPGLVRQTLALAAAKVVVNDTRDEAPANGQVALTDLAASGEFDLPTITDKAPFPGGAANGTMSISALGFAMSAPKTPQNAQAYRLHYDLRRITSEGMFDAKGVAIAGDIPDVTASGKFSIDDYDFGFQEQTGTGVLSGTGQGFAGAFEVNVPALPKAAGLGEALAKGLAISARMDSAAAATDISFNEDDVHGKVAATSGPGVMELTLSRAGLIMSVARVQTAIAVTSSRLGQAFDATLGEIGFRFAMPVNVEPTAQPYAFSLRMMNLALGNSVWNLFDPASQIARTPATAVVEVSGTGHVTGDLFDEKAPKDAMPFTPDTLDLTRLNLSFGGADIAGSGALSFLPKGTSVVPEGRIKMTWKGIYGLIGKLGSVEMIPSEAMFGLRGMLGMIGKAVGPDDLVSEFEFKADGRVLANGTRLPIP